ncbi:hypothetical protein K431DRAFT_282520 [Polychaeton citri CBS 116435]|uniref:EF-hand n=1 Tax=Polychaeton citri CBS 116435 TaxID=1314669 RepID=A0A9P4USM6_9PEZI|nr:hypothetical protein K431DRAFT_282520 [Polychaeton citri CBS 116435]
MAPMLDVHRYRPAVIAVTGIAAAASIWAVYTAYNNKPPSTDLRRSNAVRRTRASLGGRPRVTYREPNDVSHLGYVEVSRGDVKILSRIGVDPLPTLGQLVEKFNMLEVSDLRQDIEMQAIYGVLRSAMLATYVDYSGRLEIITTLQGFELIGLVAAYSIEDRNAARAFKQAVSAAVDSSIDPDSRQVDDAFGMIEDDASPRLPRHPTTTMLSNGTNPLLDDLDRDQQMDADGADTESPGTRGRSSAEDRSQGLKKLLYAIAEEEAKRKAFEHRGIACEECGAMPIQGIRYHCLNCPDFDLCSVCESRTVHIPTHVFAKIRIPLPILSQPMKEMPVWYPGDPRKVHSSGPYYAMLQKHLTQVSGYDEPQLDALFDQFCSVANVPYPNDINHIKAAIDRRAFDKAFASDRWSQRSPPSVLYDAMFSFYDTNHDGLIGFEEFVVGIAYLRGPKRFDTLRRALMGYDLDGDGYVDRQDFLRLYRDKFQIHRGFVKDMVECYEGDQTITAMEQLRSTQPISAVFMQEEMPQGETRRRTGKRIDQYGDLQPTEGTRTILDEDDPWRIDKEKPHERLRRNLSRFEELLNGDHASEEARNEANEASVPSVEISALDDDDLIDLGLRSSDARGSKHDRPVNLDVYWFIVEGSLNECLDPIFAQREATDATVESTREERKRWKVEIDKHIQQQKAAEKEMEDGAMFDPLLAIAFDSKFKIEQKPDGEGEGRKPDFGGDMIPTDEHTLSQFEADINNQSLEDLLAAAGYSTDPLDHEGYPISIRNISDDRGDVGSPGTAYTSSTSTSNAFDPTLPQNKPNNIDDVAAEAVGKQEEQRAREESPPGRERLSYLAWHDHEERDILSSRGGPGRLSLDEVEQMCSMDRARELRGLVLAWLEWASF